MVLFFKPCKDVTKKRRYCAQNFSVNLTAGWDERQQVAHLLMGKIAAVHLLIGLWGWVGWASGSDTFTHRLSQLLWISLHASLNSWRWWKLFLGINLQRRLIVWLPKCCLPMAVWKTRQNSVRVVKGTARAWRRDVSRCSELRSAKKASSDLSRPHWRHKMVCSAAASEEGDGWTWSRDIIRETKKGSDVWRSRCSTCRNAFRSTRILWAS